MHMPLRRSLLLAVLVTTACVCCHNAAATPPPPPPPSVSPFNAKFPSPSFDGPSQNIPVGNGEVVANVWVDGVRDGSLALLLGRSDVFSGNVQPLKLGRLRIELEPNPFAGWFHDDDDDGGGGGGGGGGSAASTTTPSFSQTLDLQRGLLNISAGGVNITVWSDINAVGTADSVHVEVSSPGAPVSVNVQVDSWRLDPMFVDCHNNARGPCEKNFTLPADTLVHGSYYSDPFYALGWFRRNEQSVFKQTLRDQQMGARNIGNASNSIFLLTRARCLSRAYRAVWANCRFSHES